MLLTETGADISGEVSGVALDVVFNGLLDLSSGVLEFITDNPLMFTMFAGSLVGVACYVLRKIKHTSKV